MECLIGAKSMNFLLFGTISLLVIWGLGHLYSDVRRVRDWQIASRQAKNLAIDAQSTSYDGLISAVAEGASGIGVKTAVHSGEASSSEAAASGIGHLLHTLGHFIHH